MQRDELTLESPEQARALQQSALLARFLEPASPSDVARELGMAANLAHHHAKRLAKLGLLEEVERREGRIYYRLVARRFKYSPDLLPSHEAGGTAKSNLDRLVDRFVAEHERWSRYESGADPQWEVAVFDREGPPPWKVARAEAVSGRPPHLQLRTLSLTPATYRRVLGEMAALLNTLEPENAPGAQACTLALVGFDGPVTSGNEDSMYLATSIPPAED